MRTLCIAVLVLPHLVGVVWANQNLRRQLGPPLSEDEVPIHPIAVETLGHRDPLLAGLSIPDDASVTGVWGDWEQWPMIPIHVAVLPDDKVITYGAKPGLARYDGRTYTVWNPKLGIGDDSRTIIPIADHVQSFCSSGILLHDGTFV